MSNLQPVSRPHMVMLVGNHVVGDSRVEKAAQSAQDAGYKVTIVGIQHRTVHRFGSSKTIPILRVTPDFTDYNDWVKANKSLFSKDALWRAHKDLRNKWSEETEQRVKKIEYKASRNRLTKRVQWMRPFISSVEAQVERRRPAPSVLNRQISSLSNRKRVLQSSFVSFAKSNSWRETWPQISSLEEAFFEALVELKPDIIHVHDRHPMSAADRYSETMAVMNKTIPWIYDAHEWLPGQFFSGPPNHKTSWLAAEMDLIQRATAVITVSKQLAIKMQRRHALKDLPNVVVNAPSQFKITMPPSIRKGLREECGLSKSVPLLVYVGKLAERRGIFDIVQSLKLLPSYHLAFVASKDPKVRDELRALALRLGLSERVHIFDYVPAESVTWYISSADIGLSPLHPTPAHHSALPTKIREYLHAGLPIVASELRAQSKFLRETRTGVTHKCMDPRDISRAVKHVYEDLRSFQTSITSDLLSNNSWQNEEKVLHKVWNQHALVSPNAENQRPIPPAIDIRLIESEDQLRDELIHSSFTRDSGSGRYFTSIISPDPAEGTSTLPTTNLKVTLGLENWRNKIAGSDGIVLQNFRQIVGEPFGSLRDEVRSWKGQGTSVIFLTSSGRFERANELRDHLPFHPSHDLQGGSWDRYQRQLRRSRNNLAALEITTVTTSRFSRHILDGAVWAPAPVILTEPSVGSPSSALKFLVAPGYRGKVEKHAVGKLTDKLRELGHFVVIYTGKFPSPIDLVNYDYVIDTLGLGDYSEFAASAMGSGCIVIGCDNTEFSDSGVAPRPGVSTNPFHLVDDVVNYIGQNTNVDEMKFESHRYAAEIHGGVRTRNALLSALNLDF